MLSEKYSAFLYSLESVAKVKTILQLDNRNVDFIYDYNFFAWNLAKEWWNYNFKYFCYRYCLWWL